MAGAKVTGAKEAQGFVAKVGGESSSILREAIRKGTFLASALLSKRLSWPQGGFDPFWGKLSPTAGPYLRGRSGKTASRISGGGIVLQKGDTFVASVGSPDHHVAFHEEGGVIPADFPQYPLSPHGFLRIATIYAQTPAGADRYGGQSIRDIPGSYLFRSRRGTLWAAQGQTLLYMLVKRSPRTGRHRARKIFATTQGEVAAAIERDSENRIKAVMRG